MRGERCVLVLDGLEPLQYASNALRGQLKDKAIRQFLRQFARHAEGLCIITTRIEVYELSGREAPLVVSQDLQDLCPSDGAQLLASLGVTGRWPDLEQAAVDFGCHALTLSLLGNLLRKRCAGDVDKRDTLPPLFKAEASHESRHAFKVMQAYQDWFAGQPELQLLYLLGLFDHPIGLDVLQVLWQAQIPELTAGISEDGWLEAIDCLRNDHHLLADHEGRSDLLDCHPLIREYFGRQLQTQQPDGWRQAHERLYEYYKALPDKELPDTLEEMQPLFSSVAHGCQAGLHLRAMTEVFWPRISRQGNYIVSTLGAFSDALATLAHFFITPWHSPAPGLTESGQGAVLNWAGFTLHALGRLYEALEPMQASIEMNLKLENWKSAAVNASNLSELQLTLGQVAEAVSTGQSSVDYAERSGDMFRRMANRTTHAESLHQAGDQRSALALFDEAEQLQQELQPEYPRLYSLWGFRYCEFLQAQSNSAEVMERGLEMYEWDKPFGRLLDDALHQLTIGSDNLKQALPPNPLLPEERIQHL